MDLEKKKRSTVLLFLFVILMFFSGISMASLYQVGDSPGWTIIGNVDYNTWASSKTFQDGDTIIFKYDPQFHNVMQVTRSDFHKCDATHPIKTFATGNDTIVLRGHGHYYYICGFMGHCEAGQKVDIRVPKSDHRGTNATSSTIPPSPSAAENPHRDLNPDASPAVINNGTTPLSPLSPENNNSSSGEGLLRNGMVIWCCCIGLLMIIVLGAFDVVL